MAGTSRPWHRPARWRSGDGLALASAIALSACLPETTKRDAEPIAPDGPGMVMTAPADAPVTTIAVDAAPDLALATPGDSAAGVDVGGGAVVGGGDVAGADAAGVGGADAGAVVTPDARPVADAGAAAPAPPGMNARANGAACSAASGCQSGFCVDNVCCATACDSSCVSCALPGRLGTCEALVDEPDRGTCEGSGHLCVGASGCATLDQSSGPVPVNDTMFGTDFSLAQTLTVSHPGKLVAAKLALDCDRGAKIKVEVLPVKNGLPAGAALASTTSASSFPDAKLGLTLFTFVRPAIVAPGDVIALAISANKTCHTRNYPSDVYPGGTAVTGTGIAAFPWIDLFGVDEFFETYVVP